MSRKSRRRFIKESAGALGAALLSRTPVSAQLSAASAPTDPNILLIITDQQRPDTLGFRGLTPCRTPNLDRLAAEGISFDRCLTPTPICLPARTSLFTSRYGHQTETVRNTDTLSAEPVLLTRLKNRGYQVNYAGKWGMGKSVPPEWVDRIEANETAEYTRWCIEHGLPDGWTFNDPTTHSPRRDDVSSPATAINPIKPEQTSEAWTVDHALGMLDRRDKNRPFF